MKESSCSIGIDSASNRSIISFSVDAPGRRKSLPASPPLCAARYSINAFFAASVPEVSLSRIAGALRPQPFSFSS